MSEADEMREIISEAANRLGLIYSEPWPAHDVAMTALRIQKERMVNRPSAVYHAELEGAVDGWIACYGSALWVHGKTPAEAMANFDKVWKEGHRPNAPSEPQGSCVVPFEADALTDTDGDEPPYDPP